MSVSLESKPTHSTHSCSVESQRLLGGKTKSKLVEIDRNRNSERAKIDDGRKDLQKGLSPPKNFKIPRIAAKPVVEAYSANIPQLNATQMDNSQNVKDKEEEEGSGIGTSAHAPPVGSVIGEDRQNVMLKGEYLTRTPKTSLILLLVEMILLLAWSACILAAPSTVGLLVLGIINSLLILVSLLVLIIAQIRGCHWDVLTFGDQQRYIIPYKWRMIFFLCHWFRGCLLLSILIICFMRTSVSSIIGAFVSIFLQILSASFLFYKTLCKQFTLQHIREQ